jgi:hypothetical protein
MYQNFNSNNNQQYYSGAQQQNMNYFNNPNNCYNEVDRQSPSSIGSISPSPSSASDYSGSRVSSPLNSDQIPIQNIANSTPYAYNYYYNQNHNKPFNNNNSLNDSNYYSINNDSSLLNTNRHTHTMSQPEKKPYLKFSIDAILGLTSSDDKQLINKSVETSTTTNSKKRKGRKSDIDNSSSNKRLRTIFTQEQLDKLEEEFMRQQYMVGSERSYLAAQLNLSESQVKIWFQNRRIKWRKTSTSQQNGSQHNDDIYQENDDNSYLNESNNEE